MQVQAVLVLTKQLARHEWSARFLFGCKCAVGFLFGCRCAVGEETDFCPAAGYLGLLRVRIG